MFKVEESVSGESRIIKGVKTPTEAIIEYLKNDAPINLDTGIWNYDFEVTQLGKRLSTKQKAGTIRL